MILHILRILSFFRYEYHWADGSTVKRPLKCSAPKYIDYLMAWVQEQLEDENVFPSKIGTVLCSHPVYNIHDTHYWQMFPIISFISSYTVKGGHALCRIRTILGDYFKV